MGSFHRHLSANRISDLATQRSPALLLSGAQVAGPGRSARGQRRRLLWPLLRWSRSAVAANGAPARGATPPYRATEV